MEDKDMSNIVSASTPTPTNTNSQPSPWVLVEETDSTEDSTSIENVQGS